MNIRPALLFHCQHSLGLGHLARSLALCQALTERFDVTLLSGGTMPPDAPVPAGVRVVSLPPLSMGTNGDLVGENGEPAGDATFRLRAQRILATFDSVRPRAVVVELFPFGRKKFAAELVPLLERARRPGGGRALVACSLRDILVSRGDGQRAHDERAALLVNRLFDLVLVHSDPSFARLEESFLPATPLLVPVHHTGFVAPTPRAAEAVGRSERIVVSAGGGRVGAPLLEAAMDAHELLAPARPMRLIAGPLLPGEAWAPLAARAQRLERLELVRSVPGLGPELRTAAGSVSQCGYNTALELLSAGVPALVVPFAADGEDEQTRRARRLAALGAVRVLDQQRLDGSTLAAEIAALDGYRPRTPALDVDGAATSTALIARSLAVAEAA